MLEDLVFQEKCLGRIVQVLWPYKTCRCHRANWDAANLVRSIEKKMGWIGGVDVHPKSGHAQDSSRKYEGTIERDPEKTHGARNDGT